MDRTRRELMPGVYLTCLRTERFKTALLSLHLLTGLDRQTAAQNAALPGVLRRGTVSAPDMTALAVKQMPRRVYNPAPGRLGVSSCHGSSPPFSGSDHSV